MSSKSKGYKAEIELVHKFWSTGKWIAIRSAGSGSMKYPGPDLLVGNKTRRLAIECKSSKGNKIYLDEHDVQQLKDFSNMFDAKPLFAVRFARKDWLFLNLDELEKTPSGYVIDFKVAELRGISFEELISY